MMKANLVIDDDTADGIVRCSLKQTIGYLKSDVSKLKSKNTLSNYDKQELADYIMNLESLKKVYDYYGGNIK